MFIQRDSMRDFFSDIDFRTCDNNPRRHRTPHKVWEQNKLDVRSSKLSRKIELHRLVQKQTGTNNTLPSLLYMNIRENTLSMDAVWAKKPVLKEYPLFFLVNLLRPRDRCLPIFVLQFSEFDEKAPIQHHVSKQTISNTFLNCHRSRHLTTNIFKLGNRLVGGVM